MTDDIKPELPPLPEPDFIDLVSVGEVGDYKRILYYRDDTTRAAIDAAVAAAVTATAERCAQECEAEAALWRGQQDISDFKLCAARIRATAPKGQTPNPNPNTKGQ